MIHLVVSLEWRNCAPGWPVIVLPSGRDAARYDWRFAAGLDVCVIYAGTLIDQQAIVTLLRELFRVHCPRVVLFDTARPESVTVRQLPDSELT
jgi:hypothetical protein